MSKALQKRQALSNSLETTHRILSLRHRAMVLLQPIIQIFAGTMFHFPPERFPDSFWIGGVFIRGDLLRCVTHCLRLCFKEGFSCFQITSLAQAYIDQVAEPVDSSIEITPVTFDFEIGLIYVPLFPGLALAYHTAWALSSILTLPSRRGGRVFRAAPTARCIR